MKQCEPYPKRYECHSTEQFKNVGRILQDYRSKSPIDVLKILKKHIDLWLNQIKLVTQDTIDENPYSTGITEIKQIIQDRSGYIGCGMAEFNIRDVKERNFYLACYYSFRSLSYTPVYVTGSACSKCKSCDKRYKGLCDDL